MKFTLDGKVSNRINVQYTVNKVNNECYLNTTEVTFAKLMKLINDCNNYCFTLVDYDYQAFSIDNNGIIEFIEWED